MIILLCILLTVVLMVANVSAVIMSYRHGRPGLSVSGASYLILADSISMYFIISFLSG